MKSVPPSADGANPVKNISGQDVLLGVNDPADELVHALLRADRIDPCATASSRASAPFATTRGGGVLLPAEHHRAALSELGLSPS